ncbi:prolyl-tRNA synthetase associated domain-containing protein [Acidaminobacter hydrogenoformans]|uniref:Ala-tRNA(Pro) deacylase n=1 Tax=Acidaminobacter hydrogenoformans DSM 2784 TaxID=1120920 RepID=A0A1G5RUE6_9FIRM|nr:prolyl-tRNA synthetase associated domain-containing protein [Acidaminobacter hydrogenoformans]SCZ77713.1 Ala-tRNA(Pro) deacylase [Acidaminobacter hydrogenoformans DSM 2784]
MTNEERAQKVFDALDGLGIGYEVHTHPPVATVEEAKNHWDHIQGTKAKNLFVRDQKGKKHYLIVLEQDKPLNMKWFSEHFGLDKLSFASPERMEKYLGLQPGSVSPFGLINDANKEVIVYIDEEVMGGGHVNFHPNVNTMTLNMASEDFKKYLKAMGNKVHFVAIHMEG